MKTDSNPPPTFYVSRFYSLVKRLAWGLFVNSILVLLSSQCVFNEWVHLRRIREKNIGVFLLVQLGVVPILLVLWALLKPRRYKVTPSLWTLPLFLTMIAMDCLLATGAYMFSAWLVWPPQFAR